MDPQQRLVLELGYQALHRSSMRRGALRGREVGVHVAIEHLDWQLLQLVTTSETALQRMSAYAASGEQGHVAAGRLSFALDLQGPSMSINTVTLAFLPFVQFNALVTSFEPFDCLLACLQACSSGLVSLHLGAAALRTGESEIDVSAGVKTILLPFVAAPTVLALDGRSKSFDNRGDGYGRSEAAGSKILA
eukprot:1313333-Prymnesium_polylepis.1